MKGFNLEQAREWLLAQSKTEDLPDAKIESITKLIRLLDEIAWLGSTNFGSQIVWPVLKAQTQSHNILKGSFLITMLPYYVKEEDNPSQAYEPSALVARFARRNYYRELTKRLQRIIKQFSQKFNFSPQAFRIFVNSKIPEKVLAYAAGLGQLAQNHLLYHPNYGSFFIIGLVFIPFVLEKTISYSKNFLSPQAFCQNCKICQLDCPTGALGQKDLGMCLKAMFDQPVIWPDHLKEKLNLRFYGCDLCQEICPHNQKVKEGYKITEGEIGPLLKLSEILSKTPSELKAFFKKTALGMNWVSKEALLRNALCVAGNGCYKTLEPLITSYLTHPLPLLKDAAAFALRKLKSA